MKKRLITILIGILLCIMSVFLASCKDEGDIREPEPTPVPEAPASPDAGTPEGTIPDTGHLGVEIEALSFRYLTESEYNEGEFSDDLLRDAASFKENEPYCYMVLDITYRKEKGSVELGDLDVLLKIPSRGVLDMRIEEAATSKITEKRDGSGVSCSLSFSIPTSAEEQKTERIVLRLLAVSGGEESVCVSFGKNSGATSVSSQLTQRITTGTALFSYRISTFGTFYSVVKVHSTATERVEIPERLSDGLPVAAIGEAVFMNCTQLREVVLSPELLYIGDSAFERCTSLTELEMPAVESIGSKAFKDCTGLVSIELPCSVTSVGVNAFSESLMMTHENARYLGNRENPYLVLVKVIDKTLTTHTVHESTKVIADNAFYQCEALTGIVLPASVTDIGENAFRACAAMTQIEMPAVIGIGGSAFYGCKDLIAVVLPPSLTTIGADAFAYCAALTEIAIPASVQRIESGTFSGCVKLSSVILPESLRFIAQYAFHACHALTSVTLPVPLGFIGHNAFNACVGLETVYYGGTVEQWNAFSGREETWLGNSTVAKIVCSDDTIIL